MSKFCTSCGTQLPDGANVCPQCGAPVNDTTPANENSVPSQTSDFSDSALPTRNSRNTIIGIAAIFVALLIIDIIVISVFAGGGYKKPIKNYFNGIEDNDYKQFSSSFIESKSSSLSDSLSSTGFKFLVSSIKNEYGKDIDIDIDFKSKKKLESSDIKNIESSIKSNTGKKIEVKKAYSVSTKIKIDGSKKDDKNNATFVVYKSGSKWYLILN